MNLLKKLLGEGVPQWAKPIGRAQFKEFQNEVELFFLKGAHQADYDWSNGTAFIPSIEFKINFHNLIEEWKRVASQDRRVLVANFLGGLIDQNSDPEIKISSCLDRVMIRIHDIESVSLPVMVAEPIGSFLFMTLVLDSETTTRTIHPKNVEEEGLISSDLFETAKSNLWSQVVPEISRRDAPFGRLTFIEADYFGASFISVLERFTERDKLYWVSTPSRHMTLLVEPIDANEDALQRFLEISGKITDSVGNLYLLPFLLEFKDGVFRDLCQIIDGNIEIA